MDPTVVYRLASRGLPRLPFPLNVRIQRLGRAAVPGRRLRAAVRASPAPALSPMRAQPPGRSTSVDCRDSSAAATSSSAAGCGCSGARR